MRFDMGAETLSQLVRESDSSGQDLGSLVRRLVVVAEPLEGAFNGAGRVAFDEFKVRVDEIASELTSALGSIVEGQAGMDQAFGLGDMEASDNSVQAMGSANFDGARFGSAR
ncbi:MAG: hypothetical protein ACRCTR_09720 [Actinomycetota bacterium]